MVWRMGRSAWTWASIFGLAEVLRLGGVGEVGEQVALDAEGDGRGGVAGHLMEEIGVGVVLEGVGAGLDFEAGVEVLVGRPSEVVAVARVCGGRRWCDEGVDVVLLGFGSGAAEGEVGERADLWDDEDEAGEQVGAEPGVAAIGCPVVGGGEVGDLLVEGVERGAGNVGRQAIAVEQGLGVGDAGQQGADGVAVAAELGDWLWPRTLARSRP
jgi:hypothetical protein